MEDLESFIESFKEKMMLLLKRINKFTTLEENTDEYYIYFDIILIQIRAMFIENERNKNNYTSQIYAKNLESEYHVSLINNILHERLLDDFTIRDGIKLIVDKTLAHYDFISEKDKEKIEICKRALMDKNSKYNLHIFALKLIIATADSEIAYMIKNRN